ncbi:MAG TPA: PAS domain-containing protein [Isosphaeraceae bacterium]|jgi:PAS domain-containing protein|nr:PAS domain-containing protein [Isosphaeraceae bacterium]
MATKQDRQSSDERTPELAFLEQQEWLQVQLSSIGDAVVKADANGAVTLLNAAAQSLTGWSQAEAAGVALEAVLRTINEESRIPVENSAARALRAGSIVGLPDHSLLIARGRDGAAHPRQRRPDPRRGG